MSRAKALIVLVIGGSLSLAAKTAAEDQPPPRVVAARVNGQPVLKADVDRLIVSYLNRHKLGASQQDIDFEIERIKKDLARREIKLEDQLKELGWDHDALRFSVAWQLGWQRYLDRFLVDANLQKFFEQRRKHFDGTQVRVSHILLKAGSPENGQTARLIERARKIRADIQSAKLSFADAATQFSDAPTGAKGGDIGWISRDKPMPESFSRAAFELAKGQVSEPVETAFGVHLMQVTDIKPGEKSLADVRNRVVEAATRYVFDWVANQERPRAKIEYTGAVPYFKPGTRELVTPR